MDRIVVVGGGLAGGRTVVELREQGFSGAITLVGAEEHRPYDRPPLSKAVLSGRTDDTTLPFDLDGVELLLGRHATGLRPGVLETDGGPIEFDGLVLATGAAPVRLPGSADQRVLRTIDDARALRETLRPGARLVVVGAGWIGAEVATHAAAHEVAVTVVEAGASPLLALGPVVGGHTVPWYAAAGIDLRLGAAVAQIRSDGVELAGGEFLPADAVVVGVGVRPDVSWLESSGLQLDRGVVVDEWMSAVPGADAGGAGGYRPGSVVGAGDCTAWWSRRYERRMRVEHWECAQESPRVAVATLLRTLAGGQPSSESPDDIYNPVPYFWSQQFGRMIQFAGLPGPDSTLVLRGDPTAVAPPGAKKAPGWSAGWFAPDGRLVALATVARPLDMVAGRRMLLADAAPDVAKFSDLDIALKELAPQPV
ncbi:3-phenylpropionate/trans-cinnamate dioxygenase ferredoxin reductase subunit [Parafrankia irregularis]|uniref:3-phenylpropionate/trans-cinnamate dioxygenase ferredoxin reductase subunit n=1 Tax=Parafrankia irregularis TaxID=795642 RepID=A0A0S4QZM1_9ACTN|nr:FAD-dependent oxidoreductase [Parafrankia irregularis]CUU60412.1 3-phenylpropionate/trans-cinnamate dioxygenase ferredoxin reductase subunit [Parafrankia irregularis]